MKERQERQCRTEAIRKTFSGIEVSQIPAAFSITVSGEGITRNLLLEDASSVSEDGLTYTWVLSDLGTGTFSISEDGADIDDYDLSPSISKSSVTLKADSAHEMGADDSTYTWTDLPKYESGKLIEYSVKETKVPEHFISSTEKKNAQVKNGKAVITNTFTEKQTDAKGGIVNTGDGSNLLLSLAGLISAVTEAFVLRRKEDQEA